MQHCTSSAAARASGETTRRRAGGPAFVQSIAKMPDLNPYGADKRHPRLAGSYLAACTTYAALFKTPPGDLKYTAGLDPAIARHLQTVAWETVQEYFKPCG